jgi:hypothetical protein
MGAPKDTGNPAHEDRQRARKEQEKRKQALEQPQPTQPTEDPEDMNGINFWEAFANEWHDAEENIRKNDEFMKQQMDPAHQSYQQRLSGLSNEQGFSPINIGMGDFNTSFMPQRSIQNAGNVLQSQNAQAQLMQPRSAETSYREQLAVPAMFERENEIRKWIAKKQAKSMKQAGDSGSWMDAITDSIGLVKSGKALWDMF